MNLFSIRERFPPSWLVNLWESRNEIFLENKPLFYESKVNNNENTIFI